MSNKHNDYTRFSNQAKTEATPAVITEEVDVEVTPAVITEEVAPVEDTIDYAVYGVVEGCKMLNVRQEGNINAPIISIIAAGNVVRIIEEESTEDFYKVDITNESVSFDGFCMKKYIRLI